MLTTVRVVNHLPPCKLLQYCKPPKYLEVPEITIQNDLEILESEIISSIIKLILSAVLFLPSARTTCWKTVTLVHTSSSGSGKDWPRGAAADAVGLVPLENQEREALAVQQFWEEDYLSVDNQKKWGILLLGHCYRMLRAPHTDTPVHLFRGDPST